MAFPSGVDVFVQLSERLVEMNVRQQFDVDLDDLSPDEEAWHIEVSDPPFKMRALESPELSLQAGGQAVITFPLNDFETEQEIEVRNGTRVIPVEGQCTFTLTTGFRVQAGLDGKVELYTSNGQVLVEILDFHVLDEDPSLGPIMEMIKERVRQRINERLQADGGVFIEDRLISQLDLSKQGIPAGQFRIQVSEDRLILFATAAGSPPSSVESQPVDHDLVVGLSAGIMTPKIQAMLDEKRTQEPRKKIDDNYKLKIHTLNASLVENGIKLTGSATAVGTPNDWWEVFDWYPDIDADIKKLVMSFKEIKQPGGTFVFEKTEEDIDVDNWDIFRLILSGIFTFGLGWGANPLWWFGTPIAGWIAGIVNLVGWSDAKQPSALEMTPDTPREIAGVRIQIVDLRISAEGFLILGDIDDDLSTRSAALTGVDNLRAQGETEPAHLREVGTFEVQRDRVYRFDRKLKGRWWINGRLVAELPWGDAREMELGPLDEADVAAHNGLATLTVQLLRRRGETWSVVKEMSRTVGVHGPFGLITDCYIHNKRQYKLHVAVGEGRCYQIALGAAKNRAWGLPPDPTRVLYSTCEDCFGIITPLDDVMEDLLARRAQWEAGHTVTWPLVHTPPSLRPPRDPQTPRPPWRPRVPG